MYIIFTLNTCYNETLKSLQITKWRDLFYTALKCTLCLLRQDNSSQTIYANNIAVGHYLVTKTRSESFSGLLHKTVSSNLHISPDSFRYSTYQSNGCKPFLKLPTTIVLTKIASGHLAWWMNSNISNWCGVIFEMLICFFLNSYL